MKLFRTKEHVPLSVHTGRKPRIQILQDLCLFPKEVSELILNFLCVEEKRELHHVA